MPKRFRFFVLSKGSSILLCFIILGGFNARAFAGGKSDLQKFGDVLQFGLPIAAYVGTFIADDPEGRTQYTKALASQLAIVFTTKSLVNKIRPGDFDEDTGKSFPSGHTSGAFSGASFIQRRYGWLWGAPAYVLAGVCGYSRIDAQAHYFDDVIIGASVGMLTNWYFTSPYSQDVFLTPYMGDGEYGAVIQAPFGGDTTEIKQPLKKKQPRFRYELGIGPSWTETAKARSPSDGGMELNLNDWVDEPIPNGYVNVESFYGKRHNFRFKIQPVEYRENNILDQPVTFNSRTFAANQPTRLRYRLNEFQIRYRYDFLLSSPWEFKVGAGLGYYDSKVELIQLTPVNTHASAEEWQIVPLAHLAVGYRFNDRWSVAIGTDFMYGSGFWKDEWMATVRYQINGKWDISAGYRGWAGEIDESDLYYQYAYHGPLVTIGYSFY